MILIAILLMLVGSWSSLETSFALAQSPPTISHTAGVGDLGTRVTIQGHTIQITGGTRTDNGAGPNLFHSFDQFNVGPSDVAQFLNTTPSLRTDNILSRVTGGNPSAIFGTIETMSYPGANLFLMNPAGIVFGPNAALNVSGSVGFTTANYLRLAGANGSQAGIFHADPGSPNLLTSSPVAAFGFLGSNPTAIALQGSTLTLDPGRSISLIGGNQGFSYTNLDTGAVSPVSGGVTITGGSLSAQDGRIHMISVASPGEILASTLDLVSNIKGQTFAVLGEAQITDESSINSSGGNGNTVIIRGGHLIVKNGSMISSDTGDISLRATDNIDIDASLVGVDPNNPPTHAGGLTFRSDQGDISIKNSSFVNAQTSDSAGSTGDITLSAPHGHIRIMDSSQVFTSNNRLATASRNVGTLGDIQVSALNLSLGGASKLGTDNSGDQRGGNIAITLDRRLTLDGGSFINTGAFGSGNSADLIIQAPEILIAGTGSDGINSGLYTSTVSSGEGGRLRLFTDNLQLTNGGILSSKSFIGSEGTIPSGHGGVINVEGYRNPGTSITIDVPGSGIFSSTEGTGAAGDIVLKGTSLTIQNGGKISAETSGISSKATGGAINITATDHVTLATNASITASTGGPGNAGNILVKATDIAVSGGSTITASSTGSGNAGTVIIQGLQGPANSFLIDGVHSGIFTKTSNTGAGGDITVFANSVRMQNHGSISGETSGSTATATGGKILVEGSTIRIENGALVTSSSTGTGSGGNIKLTAGQSVSISDSASVSARSDGPGNAGNIKIDAGKHLDLSGRSSITTEAKQASGGNIDLQATDRIRFVDSTLSASVSDGAGGGGNISIDPKLVLLQNSTVLAKADQGTGGRIVIRADSFLADANSIVNADAGRGINGAVTIQSPTSNLSGTVGQLVSKTSPPQVLLQNRCIALAGGEQSTFLLAGRDTLPGEPSGWLSSPVSMEHWTGEETGHASRLMVRNRKLHSSPVMTVQTNQPPVLSLRRLTPPGFLVRTFATEVTGCPS